jgi:hypothetical protein
MVATGLAPTRVKLYLQDNKRRVYLKGQMLVMSHSGGVKPYRKSHFLQNLYPVMAILYAGV